MTPRRALSFFLAALAALLPVSIAATNVCLAAISACLVWSLALPATRPGAATAIVRTLRSPVFVALAAYACWGLVASLLGLSPSDSARLFYKDAHKLWAFLAIAAALATAETASLAKPFALGLGLHAVYGVAQAAWQLDQGLDRIRAHGFLHPVSYAETLALGLIGVAAYRVRAAATSRSRKAATALTLVAAAALVLSQTRAIPFALLAAFAAACFAEPRWRRHALKAFLALLCVAAFWEVMPTAGRNIRSLFSHDAHTSAHRSRLVLWDVAVSIARENPLAGVGPGNYRRAFERHHPEKLDGEGSWGNAHNLYLHQLAERGSIGLFVLLGLFAALWTGALKAERLRRDAWSLWALAGTAAFLVMNMTEVAWQTEQVATLFLFSWLLGAGPRPPREIL